MCGTGSEVIIRYKGGNLLEKFKGAVKADSEVNALRKLALKRIGGDEQEQEEAKQELASLNLNQLVDELFSYDNYLQLEIVYPYYKDLLPKYIAEDEIDEGEW